MASQQRIEAVLHEVAQRQGGLAAAVDRVQGCLDGLVEHLGTAPMVRQERSTSPGKTERQISHSRSERQDARLKGQMPDTPRRKSLVDDLFLWPSMSESSKEVVEDDLGHDADGFVAPTLPNGWPEVVKVRDGLTFQKGHSSCRLKKRISSGASARNVDVKIVRDSHLSWMQRMRNPGGSANVLFDTVGIPILIYDLTVVPYLLAWDVPVNGDDLLGTVAYLSVVYWSLDIGLSFWRGFHRHGELVFNYRSIALHYLSTWFLPDFLLVTTDLFSLPGLSSSAEGEDSTAGFKMLRLMKLGKAARLLGLFKVVRIAKIAKHLFSILNGGGFAAHIHALIRVVAIFFATLWANHILSCGWFVVGSVAPSDTGCRWVSSAASDVHEDIRFVDTSAVYQYVTALHWAIAQSTLGAMEISSCNTSERFYTIVCLMLGLVCGSTLVSQLSASMVEFQMMHQEKNKQLRALRRYLQENQVNSNISAVVVRQAQERLGLQERLTKRDVPVLNLLSQELHNAVHAEICVPHLMQHPLLRLFWMIDTKWFKKFCAGAVDVSVYRQGDDVFVAGAECAKAYRVIDGTITYTQEPQTSAVRDAVEKELGMGVWLCEPALWAEWIHVGTAKATSACQLLELRADAFLAALAGHSVIGELAVEYGRAFHSRVVAAKPPQAAWPTDLEVPFTECGDLVYMMTREMRTSIAVMATEAIQDRGVGLGFRSGLTRQGADELISEVDEGKAVLVLNGAGETERVLGLVVLNLSRSDGRILAQLGTWAGERVSADCQLPAAKRLENETTLDTFQRLLSTKLPAFLNRVTLNNVEQQVTKKESKKFGINTKYLRRVCFASLDQPFESLEFCADGVQHLYQIRSDMPNPAAPVGQNDGEAGPEVLRAPERFRQHPCYYFGTIAKGTYYTWLETEEFSHLASAAGEGDLHAWAQSLSPCFGLTYADEVVPI